MPRELRQMGVIERIASGLWGLLKCWVDSNEKGSPAPDRDDRQMDRVRTIPFVILHLSVFTVLIVGWSPIAVIIAILLYAMRMFAITGFYHRYFSHRSFRTSRAMQFLFAVLGASAVQRGPLWWASNHRMHHLYSDQPRGYPFASPAWFLVESYGVVSVLSTAGDQVESHSGLCQISRTTAS